MGRTVLTVGMLAAALIGAAGCDEKHDPAASTAAVPVPAATAPIVPAPPSTPSAAQASGSIRGRVNFTGAAPAMAELNRMTDPFCAKTPMKDESVVVNANHTLQNVLVRITEGLPANAALPPPPSTPSVIDQSACMYRPRIATVVAGQTLLVKNDDQTFHNVHTYKGATTLFNIPQPMGSAPLTKVFRDDASVIRLGCDAHPWMKGFVSISSHPWQAVTGSDGSFELKSVPVGSYTVEAWHEKYGTKSAQVTVSVGAPAEVVFAWPEGSDSLEKGAQQ